MDAAGQFEMCMSRSGEGLFWGEVVLRVGWGRPVKGEVSKLGKSEVKRWV